MTAERSSVPGVPEPQGLGEDPFQFYTKVYLLFLQGLFNQFPSGSYRWTNDPKSSEIMITDQAPIPRDSLEQRPAIVTIRGAAQWANMTLDNVRNVDPVTGKKTRTDLIPCTMTLNCLAGAGPEAQRIGWIVMRHLRTFKELLQRNRIHKVGDNVSISPETPPGALVSPEADAETVNVVVSSPFFFQWTEEVSPTDAHVVQSIEAHIHAQLGLPEAYLTKAWEQNVKAKVPTIRGVPLHGTSVPLDDTPPEPIGTVEATVKT
jgi:hypothetical protein